MRSTFLYRAMGDTWRCAGREAGSIVWSYADHGGIICIMNQDMRSVRISRK